MRSCYSVLYFLLKFSCGRFSLIKLAILFIQKISNVLIVSVHFIFNVFRSMVTFVYFPFLIPFTWKMHHVFSYLYRCVYTNMRSTYLSIGKMLKNFFSHSNRSIDCLFLSIWISDFSFRKHTVNENKSYW